jgi:16S rRNA (cytidine1402-2'-O)-methyltransferase
VAATLNDLAALDGDRPVAVVRELTKIHEEVWRGSLRAGAAAFAEDPPRGEMVIVVGGAPEMAPLSEHEVESAVRARMDAGGDEGPKQIADVLSGELGVRRRQVYEAALRVKGQSERP